MSSLFTFNSSPSPPSSPWDSARGTPNPHSNSRTANNVSLTGDGGKLALAREPHEGSTEYKQSLLHPTPVRLRHLTTQLLWRLQQSCPSHNTAAAVPELSSADPSYYAALLQDSQGCYYEIGVADNGTLLGLSAQDLDESLATLGTMAATLGCKVEIIRRVYIGMSSPPVPHQQQTPKDFDLSTFVSESLYVAEAHVTPFQFTSSSADNGGEGIASTTSPQLRVTLTGPTASGKSSLVGTLTTGTLDNGRGKSRLSLLKHRHEIETGITSSIANELIGFTRAGEVVNYHTSNVDSWMDIHAAVGPRSSLSTSIDLANGQGEVETEAEARTVLLLDSAGMYRYRRTAIRGMVGWAPHYTAIVLAADLSSADDAAFEYLRLCLKLRLRFFVIVNKLDLANTAGLRSLCALIFGEIRTNKRDVRVLNDSAKGVSTKRFLAEEPDLDRLVPVLFVSAVSGKGVNNLLALLAGLPIPPTPQPQHDEHETPPKLLFHIEDTFNPASPSPSLSLVISGTIRYGSLRMGQEILVGPFPVAAPGWTTPNSSYQEGSKYLNGKNGIGMRKRQGSMMELEHDDEGSSEEEEPVGEYKLAKISSLRKCRLPVGVLSAGEAGTVGVVWVPKSPLPTSAKENLETSLTENLSHLSLDVPRPVSMLLGASPKRSVSFITPAPVSPSEHKVRKGMVILLPDSTHVTSTGFVAAFTLADREAVLTKGSTVIVYSGSVRAAARIVNVDLLHDAHDDDTKTVGFEDEEDEEDGLFGVPTSRKDDKAGDGAAAKEVHYSFNFLNTIEYIEPGGTVLVMDTGQRVGREGSGVGLGGGIVGRVVGIEE